MRSPIQGNLDAETVHALDVGPSDGWIGFNQALGHDPTRRITMGAATPRQYGAKSLAYHLRDGVAEAITCPTLVCDAENDLFFLGQPQAL